MSGKKYTEKHKVVYYETNITGKLNIGNLVELCMLVSMDQSEILDVSTKKLSSMGYGWIIMQNIINIYRMPVENECINVTTQAVSYNKFFCYRNFYVNDANNNCLVYMHTVFSLMDKEKRKIIRIPQKIIEPFNGHYTTKIERLSIPRMFNSFDYSNNYNVRFTDIDSNHHVNNVHYYEWMIDSLPLKFLKNYEITNLNIIYKNEIFYGNHVNSLAKLLNEELITLHSIKVNDTLSCTAEIKWKRI